MKLYKLADNGPASPENLPQKVVAPLPPAAPAQPAAAQQQQQAQSPQERQIVQYLTQNKNKLPAPVRNALGNPQQRQIIVSLMDSLSDPVNQQFINGFIQFTKQLMSQSRQPQPQM